MDKKEFYDTVDGNVKGFSGVSWGILPACNAGDSGSVPRMWRSPGGGNGYPLQYSCLVNPMDRGAWWLPGVIPRITKSQTQLRN